MSWGVSVWHSDSDTVSLDPFHDTIIIISNIRLHKLTLLFSQLECSLVTSSGLGKDKEDWQLCSELYASLTKLCLLGKLGYRIQYFSFSSDSLALYSQWLLWSFRVSKRTQKHHKSIIKIVHMTPVLLLPYVFHWKSSVLAVLGTVMRVHERSSEVWFMNKIYFFSIHNLVSFKTVITTLSSFYVMCYRISEMGFEQHEVNNDRMAKLSYTSVTNLIGTMQFYTMIYVINDMLTFL